VPYFTSETILALEELPKQLLIIGGGYVALEFAQIFRRMGSDVTLIERSSRILQNEDEDVADELQLVLERDGVQVVLDAFIKRVGSTAGRMVDIEIISAGKPLHVSGTHLLIATGRTPNTETLDLFKTGIQTDSDGFIPVNDQLQTAVDGIYALGDVKGGPAFTHVSYHDHIVVTDNLLQGGYSSIEDRLIPYCIFTDPELGRIGVTEKSARQQGLQYSVAKMDTRYIARAAETSETTGFLKAIIDNNTRQILGAATICTGGGELMSLLQVAMHGGLTCDELRDMMFAHPTYAEAINNLFSPTHINAAS
jgi:pyruvate/2-oxoglutarate dehydrogenase complex dihydrolipoamide dehydrogenase (E3) component